MLILTPVKQQSYPTTYIVNNPFDKQMFRYREYVNWKLTSPKFTMKEY